MYLGINQAPLTKGSDILVPFGACRYFYRARRHVNAWHMVKILPGNRCAAGTGYPHLIPVRGLQSGRIAEMENTAADKEKQDCRPFAAA